MRARLQSMAELAKVKVIAPIPAFSRGGSCARRQDGRLEVLHPRWIYAPGTGALTPLALFTQLVRPILRLRKEFPFDIIDSHFGYPDGIAAALLSGVTKTPFTVTLRGSEVLHARYRLRRSLMRWAFRRASRIITVSERLRQFAIGLGCAPEKIRTIPNGVEVGSFHPRDRRECRAKYRIPLERKVIMTAGHLIELKGHHRAAQAARHLRDQGVPVFLVIVGGTPGAGVQNFEPQIRRVVRELGMDDHVRFAGQVSPEALAELMCAADVFCLASSREGWPNVVHEALACGTPVVAADVGAIPEMIPSERYGYIVPPGDVPAMALSLKRALDAGWDHAAISAWSGSRCWAQVAGEVLDVMRQVIKQSEVIRS